MAIEYKRPRTKVKFAEAPTATHFVCDGCSTPKLLDFVNVVEAVDSHQCNDGIQRRRLTFHIQYLMLCPDCYDKSLKWKKGDGDKTEPRIRKERKGATTQ